jgi:hypothetical protein
MKKVSNERQDVAVQLVVAARRQNALFHIEGYCDGTRCPAREVRLWLKDYDDEAIALIARHGLLCPLCGAVLTIHGVRTRNEQHRHAETRARMSVSEQMYRRDQAATDQVERGIVLTPLRVLLDDRLPPTPAGWWTAHVLGLSHARSASTVSLPPESMINGRDTDEPVGEPL